MVHGQAASRRLRICLDIARLLAALPRHGQQHHGLGNGSWSDFIRGRFQGISLSREGAYRWRPKWKPFQFRSTGHLGVAEAPDGTLYAATGNRDAFTASAATAPPACCGPPTSPRCSPSLSVMTARSTPAPRRMVRCTASGRPSRGIFRAAYPLHLVVDRGARWRAVRRHRRPGQGLSRGSSRQGRVVLRHRAIARDRAGARCGGPFVGGTEPNGILYRISAKDKAFVLYNASLPEIRAIVPMPDGSVYAAALGARWRNWRRPQPGRAEPGRQPAGNRGLDQHHRGGAVHRAGW